MSTNQRWVLPADSYQLLVTILLDQVHASSTVPVTRGSTAPETHLGTTNLHSAPTIAPLPLTLLLADHGHVQLLQHPRRGLHRGARGLAPAYDRGIGASIGVHLHCGQTHWPDLIGLQVWQLLQSEQSNVIGVTVRVIVRVDVDLNQLEINISLCQPTRDQY